ncbi:hypothetical protein JOB18_010222 [Solea senegalensis]|uniref:Uncharacterized protein n=1 Tax=Solea senegalensis TaxID=28829 RepID=A0AAV6RBD0_SOLSE|nr:hypothetical protein JOB18_010222 [Solea senegalensis]
MLIYSADNVTRTSFSLAPLIRLSRRPRVWRKTNNRFPETRQNDPDWISRESLLFKGHRPEVMQGVPVRTPRRPCASLPKTSASPGPPPRQGTAKCHLDPLQSGVSSCVSLCCLSSQGGQVEDEAKTKRTLSRRHKKKKI